jgi:hypothetical protein
LLHPLAAGIRRIDAGPVLRGRERSKEEADRAAASALGKPVKHVVRQNGGRRGARL